jgi:hypothetical protein
LIEEAKYTGKYGFRYFNSDQLDILRKIVGARYLEYPYDKSHRWHSAWYYPDAPFTPEQNEEWLEKGYFSTTQAAERLGITPSQFGRLAKKMSIKPFDQRPNGSGFWLTSLYRPLDIENMQRRLDQEKGMKKRTAPNNNKHVKIWESLTEKQQKILQAVYQEDQDNEYTARYNARNLINRKPASEWRLIPFRHIQLQATSPKKGVSPTRKDFEELQKLGLIELGKVWLFKSPLSNEKEECEAVQMTRLGRAVVRASQPKKQLEREADHGAPQE